MSRAMPWGSGGGAGNRSPSGFRPDAGSKPAYFCQSERDRVCSLLTTPSEAAVDIKPTRPAPVLTEAYGHQ